MQSEQRDHWRCVLHLGVHQYPTVPTLQLQERHTKLRDVLQ